MRKQEKYADQRETMIVLDCMASKAYLASAAAAQRHSCGRTASVVDEHSASCSAKNELAAVVAVKPPLVNCCVSVWPMRRAILEARYGREPNRVVVSKPPCRCRVIPHQFYYLVLLAPLT